MTILTMVHFPLRFLVVLSAGAAIFCDVAIILVLLVDKVVLDVESKSVVEN